MFPSLNPQLSKISQVTIKPSIGDIAQHATQARAEAMKQASFAPVTDFEDTEVRRFLKDNAAFVTIPPYDGDFE